MRTFIASRTCSTPSSRTRRSLILLGPLTLLGLSACGGASYDDNPTSLTATEGVNFLTTGDSNYPAALAVRVTTASADVQVRGRRYQGGPALQGDERFPMGSITKSMTATLAGVLVQEGLIDWDSRLLDVLPELQAIARAEYSTVTLTDLLAHRAGIFPAVTEEQVAQLPPVSGTLLDQRLQLAAWALRQPPSSPPIATTQYSNGGYVVAAALLERVAGQPYERLLQAKVFAPLRFVVSFGGAGAAPGEPWGHEAGPGGTWWPVDPAQPSAQVPGFANPAGGAKLSANALARFLQLHLRALRGMPGEVLTAPTALHLHTVVQEGVELGWQSGSDLQGRPLDWHNGSDDDSYYGLVALSRSSDAASAAIVTGFQDTTEARVSAVTAWMLR